MNDSLIDEATKFLHLCVEAEGENRKEAIEDLKFVSGEQWPAEMQNSRLLEGRPCLTINKLDSFCRQISNQQRQQRPRIKVHPTNTLATKKIAEVIEGICRHVENNSNADTAYDTAFDSAVKIGFGYIRVVTDYIRNDSFDQDIYIQSIDNPFTVYFDPNSVLPDGSDAEQAIISSLMPKHQFRSLYPDADDGSNFNPKGAGEEYAGWVTKEDIRIAEYFKVVNESATLCILSDKSTKWEDELPSEELMGQFGLSVVDKRKSFRHKVMWYKLTAMEVIESMEWAGRWIPIIPVYGNITVIDGKRKRSGIVRFAKDPQRMVNFWTTAATESIALAPKAKWLIAEGQDEGHENEWARANVSAMPVLRYKQTDANGQVAPPPVRLQPEPPPSGILETLQTSTENLREVIGITDPAQRIAGNTSGKALIAEKQQSDTNTFHFYDNFTRSLKHIGRIIVDLVPKIYDTERVLRIIGSDGKPNLVTINERQTTPEGEVIKNNITIGEYDVVMDIGPGYNSKRQEAVEAMSGLMQNEQIFPVIADLFFRNSDFPGSEIIADRLAASNPLAQIDDKSDIPPQAQIMIKKLQQQIQQMQEQLQSAEMDKKYHLSAIQMQEQGETNREHMRAVSKAHDTELWGSIEAHKTQLQDKTKRFDTEVRAHTQLSVEEIKGHIALLLDKLSESKERAEERAE